MSARAAHPKRAWQVASKASHVGHGDGVALGRTCVACRRRAPAATMVRLRSVGLAAAPAAGRGGYVCIAAPCLSKVVAQPAALCEQAQAQLLALVGLARRGGQLLHGLGQVGALPRTTQATVLVATDRTGRAKERLAHHAAIASAARLGQAAGLPEAGAVAILGGRLCLQAAYWLRVWYETRVVEQRGVRDE